MNVATPYKGRILIFIVGMLSTINICFCTFSQNYLSLANSVVGIIGVMFFFLHNTHFREFIWLWVFAQTVIISHTITDPATGYIINRPIFDCSQILKLEFGITVSNEGVVYGLYYNFVTIIYFVLFRFLMSEPEHIPDELTNADTPENTDNSDL